MEDTRFVDIDSFSEEDKKRLARMLSLSRAESGLSQEAMALELGIAKKTVQNWEKGVSTPTLPQAIAWFRVAKVAAMPYFLQFMFPDIEGMDWQTPDHEVLESLISFIEVLPMEGVRQLMYLFYGNHGSSPRAVINMITAYLQLPLRERYHIDCELFTRYGLVKDRHELVKPEHIKPDENTMKTTICRERDAILNNKDSYMIL